MTTATDIRRVVSWNTKKTAAGFEFRAFSFDHNEPTTVHATGTFKTRAQAVARAKAWVRYLNAVQRAARHAHPTAPARLAFPDIPRRSIPTTPPAQARAGIPHQGAGRAVLRTAP